MIGKLEFGKDKPGKDTNFRGLTIFDNTMYISNCRSPVLYRWAQGCIFAVVAGNTAGDLYIVHHARSRRRHSNRGRAVRSSGTTGRQGSRRW